MLHVHTFYPAKKSKKIITFGWLWEIYDDSAADKMTEKTLKKIVLLLEILINNFKKTE